MRPGRGRRLPLERRHAQHLPASSHALIPRPLEHLATRALCFRANTLPPASTQFRACGPEAMPRRHRTVAYSPSRAPAAPSLLPGLVAPVTVSSVSPISLGLNRPGGLSPRDLVLAAGGQRRGSPGGRPFARQLWETNRGALDTLIQRQRPRRTLVLDRGAGITAGFRVLDRCR